MVPRGALSQFTLESNMAVLKALTRVQRERMQADACKREAFRKSRYGVAKPMREYDAHVVAYYDHLVAIFEGPIERLPVGKALRATHWWQSDYRSFAPKGVTLVNPRLTGVHGRFAVK
jgi:hypothetical protein